MKKYVESQEAKTSQEKHEFENLNVKSSDLQHLISLNSTVSYIQNCSGSLVQRSKLNYKKLPKLKNRMSI